MTDIRELVREHIEKADAFGLFTNEIKIKENLENEDIEKSKENIITFFQETINSNDEGSLIFNEAINLLNIIRNLYDDFEKKEELKNEKLEDEKDNEKLRLTESSVNKPRTSIKRNKNKCTEIYEFPEETEDEILDTYAKSLKIFTEGIDDEDLKAYVEYVTSD